MKWALQKLHNNPIKRPNNLPVPCIKHIFTQHFSTFPNYLVLPNYPQKWFREEAVQWWPQCCCACCCSIFRWLMQQPILLEVLGAGPLTWLAGLKERALRLVTHWVSTKYSISIHETPSLDIFMTLLPGLFFIISKKFWGKR